MLAVAVVEQAQPAEQATRLLAAAMAEMAPHQLLAALALPTLVVAAVEHMPQRPLELEERVAVAQAVLLERELLQQPTLAAVAVVERQVVALAQPAAPAS